MISWGGPLGSQDPRYAGSLLPSGSKYPIFKDSGPKYHSKGMVFWKQRPQILDTWTSLGWEPVAATAGGFRVDAATVAGLPAAADWSALQTTSVGNDLLLMFSRFKEAKHHLWLALGWSSREWDSFVPYSHMTCG